MTSLSREFLHCCQFAVIRYENYSNRSLETKNSGFVLGLLPAFSNYSIGYLELSDAPHTYINTPKAVRHLRNSKWLSYAYRPSSRQSLRNIPLSIFTRDFLSNQWESSLLGYLTLTGGAGNSVKHKPHFKGVSRLALGYESKTLKVALF